MEAKKTPLYEEHVKAGGKMVDFAGWMLPTNYGTGIIAEHNSTRTAATLFDVSHMGEILVEGPGTYDYIQRLVTNDIAKTQEGRAIYTPMCYENGTCVDDLLVYPWEGDALWLVVNAANDDKDFAWVRDNAPQGITVTHVSDQWGQIALQGPGAAAVMRSCGMEACNAMGFFGAGFFELCGARCVISKTGYTGEAGFEIYMPPAKAAEIWQLLMAHGATPAGLGCRDTLRFEAGLPLYGHEISDSISPLEANLGFFVKVDKGDFIGREALMQPQKRKQIGLSFLGRGVPRAGYTVFANGQAVGVVTTGSPSPTTGKNLANCIVDIDTPDDAVFTMEVRGKQEPCEKIPVPFYKRAKAKKA